MGVRSGCVSRSPKSCIALWTLPASHATYSMGDHVPSGYARCTVLMLRMWGLLASCVWPSSHTRHAIK